MTVEEFYKYITSQMTPEEALKKMLEAGLISYQKLKFQEGEEVHPLMIIAMAGFEMGWQIAVEKKGKDVRGVSIGTEDYMKNLFKK